MMLEWSMKVEFDVAMIINLMKTICSIITSNCKMVLGAFRDQGLVISLISKFQSGSFRLFYLKVSQYFGKEIFSNSHVYNIYPVNTHSCYIIVIKQFYQNVPYRYHS